MKEKSEFNMPMWSQLLHLSDHPGMPLQARLRLTIVRLILNGDLPAGSSLPSSRALAQELVISRTTTTAAYQQLTEEGYLESRPRSGVVVAADARPAGIARKHAALTTSGSVDAVSWRTRVKRSLRTRHTLSKPANWRDYPYPFVYGTYDPELFPADNFRECFLRSLSRVQRSQWTPDFETDDMPDLVEQIRLKVLPRRGVVATADEILITVGAQQAYYLLADALFDESVRVGLEEPGHPHARNAFLLRNPILMNCPVDEQGLIVDTMPPVRYVFVTPSHQSPTTHTLSLARRQDLLARADAHDIVVIEDDYESENLYDGSPIPALKSLDRAGRVIYIGSLAKSLSPALRLGYIVAPRALIAELRLLRQAMVRHPSALLQHAYAMFISLGHHDSHGRQVNAIMHERLLEAARALHEHLPEFAFTLPQGGASLWVQAPSHIDAGTLGKLARHHGVLIEPGDAFFSTRARSCRFFRLRLSSIALAHIDPGIRALARAYADLSKPVIAMSL